MRSRALTRPVVRAGLALAVVYAATVALTLGLTDHHVRPLFEGIAPAAPYQWVKPPPEFAATNVKPLPSTTDIRIVGGKFPQSGIAGRDAQLLLNLTEGSIAVPGGATTVRFTIVPLDPATLGPLPKNLAADGNAYRVQATFTPGGGAVGSVDPAGNIVLTVPHAAVAFVESDDGRTWHQLAMQRVGGSQTVIGAPFAKPGYYLGATTPQIVGAGGGGGSSTNGGRVALIAALTAAVALALAVVPVLVRRRRPPPPPAKGRRR